MAKVTLEFEDTDTLAGTFDIRWFVDYNENESDDLYTPDTPAKLISYQTARFLESLLEAIKQSGQGDLTNEKTSSELLQKVQENYKRTSLKEV